MFIKVKFNYLNIIVMLIFMIMVACNPNAPTPPATEQVISENNNDSQNNNDSDENNDTLADVPPSTPSNLHLHSVTATTVTLVWNEVEDAVSYEVESSFNMLSIISVSTYQSSNLYEYGLTPETDYFYRVKAINSYGESEWTSWFLVQTAAWINPPENLHPTNISGNSIILKWDIVDTAYRYILQRDDTLVYDGTENTFKDSGLTPLTSYSYMVRACNIDGYSEWSDSVNEVTIYQINPPSNIQMTSHSTTSISLEWDSVEEALEYELQRDETTIYEGLNQNFFDSGLSPSTVYNYRIRARGSEGYGFWSDTIILSTITTSINVSLIINEITHEIEIELSDFDNRVSLASSEEANLQCLDDSCTNYFWAIDGVVVPSHEGSSGISISANALGFGKHTITVGILKEEIYYTADIEIEVVL